MSLIYPELEERDPEISELEELAEMAHFLDSRKVLEDPDGWPDLDGGNHR